MTALPSPGTALSSSTSPYLYMQLTPGMNNSSSPLANSTSNNNQNKRKRRPAGTPDPDAEVVALSPKTLMESDRYVCEICNQGFQRDQNLQMHRRRHKVPWKLLKRPTPEIRKRVYVCPDPTCLHNDPCHALGDLVGIKKHFRRKHSIEKQWKCEKCSKGYAVQSDYKAHLKTCGTRGHSCDCGRVFSRVESFIEHHDDCIAVKERAIFGYNDPSRQPCITVATSSSNEILSGISMADRSLNMEQRELQFLPTKHQSDVSETTVTVAGDNNGGFSVTSRDYRTSPSSNSRSNHNAAIEDRYNYFGGAATEEKELPENGGWLQLSIGPCIDYEKKSHVKAGRRLTELTLSLQSISVHPIQ
ncbi:hypothetical protein SUGI_0311190 [Cryptomeria japonica]|uniref:zinc finger protein SHOOT GRAVITROPISM 5 n=1 Tax=Cryptomeria japonica TaxID=3369 RepID=UPI002408B779|nr:zinc finger protein SHOOT GRAVITROPISM 5 [Cryptomeria japonica]GLJ17800.1 hypothetical protein SUGI_0311190 [Cryptomeria japonica]